MPLKMKYLLAASEFASIVPIIRAQSGSKPILFRYSRSCSKYLFESVISGHLTGSYFSIFTRSFSLLSFPPALRNCIEHGVAGPFGYV
jgi:hypothetical protein